MYRRGWIFATVIAIAAIIINFVPKQNQDTESKPLILGRNNTALFISNAEYGQLNVFLGSAQALLLHHPDIEIHFCTFGSRFKDIDSINHYSKLKLSMGMH
ncbi:2-hydroxyacylsphingosine 1-beta-galactosyltransferase [Venturia nashicola]|uniref:2-hydroxyacylsphingosine 1-beta-galactosyltransferase n=1 Tax=Venturia nashicola TaxID=86259 RepID=A0A4Z1P5B9_9PEZI|nr:2-hydroxyacylsphingosine 1-beta-galactosyltransferase [Venturia nashicola]TLD25918.1 2-hydroxyacylsphingosine 1-beta-galactosyltransferase [Venturia nashicola]